MAPCAPEVAEGSGQDQTSFAASRVTFTPLQCGAQVVELAIEPAKRFLPARPMIRRCAVGGQFGAPGEVSSANHLGFASFLQLLRGVLADRLQEEIAPLTILL